LGGFIFHYAASKSKRKSKPMGFYTDSQGQREMEAYFIPLIDG
jgi:hypothetical protein